MWGDILIALFIVASSYTAYFMSQKGIKGWYKRITTPTGTPSATTIRTVWIILYSLYGIALITFISGGTIQTMDSMPYYWWGAASFVTVGMLGIIWTYVFFTSHKIMPSIYISALMAFLILCDVIIFAITSLPAAALAAIYLIWISYIARTSYLVWELNP